MQYCVIKKKSLLKAVVIIHVGFLGIPRFSLQHNQNDSCGFSLGSILFFFFGVAENSSSSLMSRGGI